MDGPVSVQVDSRPGVRSGGTPGAGPTKTFCPTCAADLTHLPPIARFCHRCGNRLPEALAVRGVPRGAQEPAGQFIPFAAVAPPPLILFAYGKAMFNLGLRYETAVGSSRNVEEAFRCYQKAARLGDMSAVQRLATPPPLPAPDTASDMPVAPHIGARAYEPPALPS